MPAVSYDPNASTPYTDPAISVSTFQAGSYPLFISPGYQGTILVGGVATSGYPAAISWP